jgi:hypothetical protein
MENAIFEDGYAIADGEGFLGVVGHQDPAGVAAFEQVGKLAP